MVPDPSESVMQRKLSGDVPMKSCSADGLPVSWEDGLSVQRNVMNPMTQELPVTGIFLSQFVMKMVSADSSFSA